MRRVWIALAVVVALLLAVVAIGLLLPREHVASVRVRYAAAPRDVYETIANVAHGAEWRSGVERVELLPDSAGMVRWRETADWGTLAFERIVDEPGRRIVARIVDEGQGFGGTWTWEIEADGAGSVVTISEAGYVDNPFYRFMSRFVMGYYASLETYARDLGRRLGEDVRAERLERAAPDR
ncbi:MAG TPA: SRPBCC family protein [Longimicrobiales bacterium]